MVLGSEMTHILAFLLPLSELSGNHVRQKLLGLNERHLHISVRVAIERKLTSYILRKSSESLCVLLAQVSEDVSTLGVLVKILIV